MNISIALALNYKKEDILPFLKSYEKHASGNLYLVTNNTETYLNYQKIIPIDIFSLAQKYKINLNALTVFNLKPIIFYLLLKEQKNIQNVLLTDVDVFFQKDPFSILEKIKTDTFIISEERDYYKNNDTNTTWFNAGYIEEYKNVADKKILNCGIAIGKYDSMLDYQKQVSHELQNILSKRPYFAYDQVILNVLVYSRKTLTPTILNHDNQYITHMHFVKDEDLTANKFKNGLVLTDLNEPYYIMHQYNENKTLTQFINSQ